VHEPGISPIERRVRLRRLIERHIVRRQELQGQLAQQRGRDPATALDIPRSRETCRDRRHLRASDLETASMELPTEWQRDILGPVPAAHEHLTLVTEELERTREGGRVPRRIHDERDAGARRQPLDDRADLAIVNVYLKGKLGVEVTEEIRTESALDHTRVILIGALFRANRFRANPTNLYGADEYIEEQIPEKEFTQIIQGLFPESNAQETPAEPREYDDARRLARLILSDIVIYHPDKVEKAIRDNTFFEVLHDQINEGREYYDSRVPLRVRRDTEIFTETMQQFVQMKREELTKVQAGR